MKIQFSMTMAAIGAVVVRAADTTVADPGYLGAYLTEIQTALNAYTNYFNDPAISSWYVEYISLVQANPTGYYSELPSLYSKASWFTQFSDNAFTAFPSNFALPTDLASGDATTTVGTSSPTETKGSVTSTSQTSTGSGMTNNKESSSSTTAPASSTSSSSSSKDSSSASATGSSSSKSNGDGASSFVAPAGILFGAFVVALL
ncbi:hypothetical protein CAAN1_01S13036 [[Candida] anglica]|uniref:Temperature shock-inducible protein 1 n=1 Tax=[Candida] anglica TaxID=148631 RepID=A0ABP0EKK6_9ASCO